MSRDSKNELRIIDDEEIETSTEKPVPKRLADDLDSEKNTDFAKIEEDIGEVSENFFTTEITLICHIFTFQKTVDESGFVDKSGEMWQIG